MLHTIHMTDVDPAKRIAAVRNVRAARAILGDEAGRALKPSRASVDEALDNPNTPVLVGRTLSDKKLAEARAAIERDGVMCALVDLTPEQALGNDRPGVRSTDTEPSFSDEAYSTAMTLMALTNGNPTAALMAANQLMRTTGDAQFFDEVGDVLLAVFPGPTA